ncbi:MAG: hypothetical protein CXT78_13500 [Thaumarchaeota archaeon]|nr:MAG: hypothetical protein CXT78_13500 [Nitrososphaerota archaeon]
MKFGLFGFVFAMWVLLLVGGGIIVMLLGPITISGFSEFNWLIASIIKALSAIVLVMIWILILLKLKSWIFRKEIKS